MGWFNKNSEEKKNDSQIPSLAKLPELPKFNSNQKEPLPQLPSFPSSSFGEKFSQDTIKDAVSGKKEGENIVNDFENEEDQMMQGSLKLPPLKNFEDYKENQIHEVGIKKTPRFSETVSEEFSEASRRVKKAEPIFIRLDKFEDSLKIFEKAKKEIREIEEMLRDTKSIKDEEEKELEHWETEIQTLKQQIEKIDKEIFSKVE